MLEENKKLTYSGDEIIEALKEIELILISLHQMGSYYGDRFLMEGKEKYTAEYEKETTQFIDGWNVTKRLAKVREILSQKFNRTLGNDDMDDLERAMEGLKYWSKPNDKPEKNHFLIKQRVLKFKKESSCLILFLIMLTGRIV